jgi:hypothetical protein
MVTNPFFRLKIAHVRTGSPVPVDFAMTRLLFHWHIALGRLRYANGRTAIAFTAIEHRKMYHRLLAVHDKNKMANVGSLRNGCATICIQYHSHHSALCQGTLPDMQLSRK